MKFQEFEENILKLMENKQIIEKETERMNIDNKQKIIRAVPGQKNSINIFLPRNAKK